MARTPNGTNYDLTGPAKAPVVVMIHGLGLNSACWQWTTPALRERYRILSYDLYGHGKSAPPPDLPSLGLYAWQLAALLDTCKISTATPVGFSLGGMIARRFAQDAPAKTMALAILHSPHKRSIPEHTAILKRVEQARHYGPHSMVEAALERWFTSDFRLANPDMMALVRSWITANDTNIYHTIYQVLADGIDEIVAPDPPINCPALVITGDEDFGNGPDMTRAIAAEISGAEVVILPGLRHMALAENPNSINRPLRRFLDQLEPTE